MSVEKADDGWYQDECATSLPQTVLPDSAKSVITTNSSPDIGFDQSINPYRGCSHGCVYCFARPTHAYLGLSPGLDFETKLFYKDNAVELLRDELSRRNYVCKTIALGINTDGWQPLEKQMQVTRSVLTVLAECRHPLSIVTKSALIVRDLDLLQDLARDRAGFCDGEHHNSGRRGETQVGAANCLAGGATEGDRTTCIGRRASGGDGGAGHPCAHRP